MIRKYSNIKNSLNCIRDISRLVGENPIFKIKSYMIIRRFSYINLSWAFLRNIQKILTNFPKSVIAGELGIFYYLF